jgi:hypothetical protein
VSLSREEQRMIGALVVGAQRAVEEGLSTLPGTIHADEVLMEYLVLEGVELLRDYSPEQRRRMAKEGRAMPDGSFPIANCADAERAIRAQGRAKPAKRAAVKSFIKRRVKALGCTGEIFDPYR